MQFIVAHPGSEGCSLLGQEQSNGFFRAAVILHKHSSSCEDRLDSPEAPQSLKHVQNLIQ